MLFNTIEYAFFLPIVILLYYLLPHSVRWLFLLLASCIFYMAFIPEYILILFLAIGIDYYAAQRIEVAESYKKKKRYLIISIISTCAILFFFKYFNFFSENVQLIANFFNLKYPPILLKIALPIGLSFHTFQSLSYVFEVYYGRHKAEKHLGIYALYVMFFPQLVAGPIERPQGLLEQLNKKHSFSYSLSSDGLRQILWGLFKKVVVADSCAEIVNIIYPNYLDYSGSTLFITAVLFSFQIYGDFSGYSDIAIGSAKMFGIRFAPNFNYPYFSKNIGEFWQRWHISLSSWFRDYLYIPLGGNRGGKSKKIRNVLVTFTISGLWHGANWTFLFWGLLNGLYYVPSLLFNKQNKIYTVLLNNSLRKKTGSLLQMGFTFFLITIAWIFFRSTTIYNAFSYIHHMVSGNLFSIPNIKKSEVFVIVLLFIIIEWIQRKKEHPLQLEGIPIYIRWLIYYIITVAISYFSPIENIPFIYFQF